VIDVSEESGLTLDVSKMAHEMELDAFSSQRKTEQLHTEIPNCEKIEESHINITFRSGFPRFAQFVNALERHRPVIFIDKFSISRSERGQSIPETAMTLNVLVCEGKASWLEVASLKPSQKTVPEEVNTKAFPVETTLSSQEHVFKR
jgi:hypothetical protein